MMVSCGGLSFCSLLHVAFRSRATSKRPTRLRAKRVARSSRVTPRSRSREPRSASRARSICRGDHVPGGEVAPVTVLGRHRATVVVPASATTGNLTMTFDNASAGAIPFRRVGFSPQFASAFLLQDPAGIGPATGRDPHTAPVRRDRHHDRTLRVRHRWLDRRGGASERRTRDAERRRHARLCSRSFPA